MNKTIELSQTAYAFMSPTDFLHHWQGHRSLTRKVIEAFPEKEFFNFSIGGMRPFAEMVYELLAIAGPGIDEIVSGETGTFDEKKFQKSNKKEILELWDDVTNKINDSWNNIAPGRFQEPIKLFGQYEGTVQSMFLYFIDNEIHHRGQGYVYLRALKIEPPMFYDRG